MKPIKKIGRKQRTIWNTNKKESWNRYFIRTNQNKDLDKLAESTDGDTNKLNKGIEKVMTKLEYECFGKVAKISSNYKNKS